MEFSRVCGTLIFVWLGRGGSQPGLMGPEACSVGGRALLNIYIHTLTYTYTHIYTYMYTYMCV